MAFSVANFLWTLSGSRNASDISPYNANAVRFAENGLLHGAVGGRIAGNEVGNQIELAVATLKRNPSTRRATISVSTSTDLARPLRDTPCTIALQYLIRDDQLHAITIMRSQSAAMLLPYDTFLFTMIQELIATEIGVEIGTYYNLCCSLHFYEDEEELVEKMMKEEQRIAPPMDKMPEGSMALMPRIIHAEGMLRSRFEGERASARAEIETFPAYWKSMIEILSGHLMADQPPSIYSTDGGEA